MLDAPSSRHRDVDLDIAPSLFSRDTTDRLELSQYILKDLLNCKVDCRIIMCIWSGAKGDETEASYSDQARSIASSRNSSGITTELWRMSGEMYHVLQGTISRSSFSNEVMTGNLSESRFLHYFHTCRGDFGISFNGTNKGINDTEDALALSGVDDASLKDCIVDASASVWGGLVLVTRMHSNSIHPTKTTTMMRTTHPLPRTRPVETQSPRRRGIIK
jgi:hypothetical protein